MPGGAPAGRESFLAELREAKRQIDQINSWIRTSGVLGAQTAATACRMGAQTLAVGTQAVKLDTLVCGPSGLFDLTSHCYVAPSTGLYQVSGQIATLLANNPQVNIVGFIKNGVTGTWLARGGRTFVRGGTVGDLWYLTASAIVPLTEGDHLELAAENGGGNSQALEIVEIGANNYLSAARVA